MRIALFSIIIVLLVVGAGGWYLHENGATTTEFKTAKVTRGDLVSTIAATGTLEPEEVIDVGAQVSGIIETFGKDANGNQIDYRSPVKADQILATIDDTIYQSDLNTAEAQIKQGEASVKKANADLETDKAKLAQAESNWNRVKGTGPNDALSANDYDTFKADYETAKATVDVANAEIAQAEAEITQANASLLKATKNVGYCKITSPVDGIIIDRRVNVGQTVVSSMSTSSMFLIAKDLKRMQIWVAVNEADIGRIQSGTPATFTCDAFPDRVFRGTVGKVRLNATMAQNVVMYTVEVNTDNSSGVLLPYLTANVKFEVQRDPDVLLVPNAALRWYPTSAEQVVPDARATWKPVEAEASPLMGGGGGGGGGGRRSGGPDGGGGPPGGGPPSGGAGGQGGQGGQGGGHHRNHDGGATSRPSRERKGTLWIKDGEFVRPVEVKLGATDSINTAVSGEAVTEATEVVTGEVAQSAASGERNPFLPQMRRR
jgi:HlyD family secretion protein